MNEVFPEIYKKDSKGKIRTWQMELSDNKYRTIAGTQGGKLVTSKWTRAKGKNTGKANETSDEEQAVAVIDSMYRKKLSVDYHESIDDIETVKTFLPMLATEYSKRKSKLKWATDNILMQPKLDGIRCIAKQDGLFTRTGKKILSSPHIEAGLADIFEKHPTLVLDGELYNHLLKDDFNEITSLVKKTKPSKNDLVETAKMVEYHVYDIGSSTELFPARHTELQSILNGIDMIELLPIMAVSSEEECDAAHAQFVELGYEGSMLRLSATYGIDKRSSSLIKRKDFDDAEFKIIGFEEGKGNFAGLPKVILIELPSGGTGKATMTGTRESLMELKDNFNDYIGKRATVQFFGWTPDGQLRFPIVKQIHRYRRW